MRWPLAVILLIVFTESAMARDADAGREAFLAGDYAKARHILEPLADKGDAEALYWTGVMYSQGRGYRSDCREAAYRYEQAARQGFPEAIFSLGFLLYYGAGAGTADCEMIPDHDKAAPWLLRAARMGKPRAQFLVGRMYRDGDGLRKSTDDAFDWLEKAAKGGIGEAQFDFALLCARLGNYKEAYFWFRVLSRKGYPGASQNAARLAQILSAAEIDDIDRRARQWKAAD
jgi:TPR repeat protein